MATQNSHLTQQILKIALDVPLDREFDYLNNGLMMLFWIVQRISY